MASAYHVSALVSVPLRSSGTTPGPTDLLQIGPGDREGPAVLRVDLGGDAKHGLNEPDLPDYIALRQPPDLPFPDQRHRFVTVDRPQYSFCRPKPQTRRHALLDKSIR